ncbi:FecR domain-containing protein [Chitinophaga sp. MM2321]|uniref:FecR family protein n=1 Tax=Chitinophaga sp. MM2321 TaxID=3137178 RepID=UPI0032D58E2D
MNEHRGFWQSEIANLIVLHIRGTITEDQEKRLQEWLNASEKNKKLFLELSGPEAIEGYIREDRSKVRHDVLARIYESTANKETDRQNIRKRKRVRRILQVAAVLLLAIGASLPYLLQKYGSAEKSKQQSGLLDKDVAPGSKKAVLLLGNGQEVDLTMNKDTSFTQGAVVHVSKQGMLSYITNKGTVQEDQYHTMITPNGGEYHLQLSDGTNVWLNAASSIRFPAQFTGGKRMVEITGEVYLEVARDMNHPFMVSVQGMEVLVLGTAFNIQAYQEDHIQTTLLSGAVRLKEKEKTLTLQPGKTAVSNGLDIKILPADTLSVMAWKNGNFRFRGMDMKALSEQLARWYDIQIRFAADYDQRNEFVGEISRDVPLSEVLEMIQSTGVASFKIENKTVYISTGQSDTNH